LSVNWVSVPWHDSQVRSAFLLSLRVGLIATALALVLGSAVAYALHKFAFFGREAISFLLVLPLALPGIITGVALNSFFSFTGIQLGTATIVIGHTTFCIVVVYNNLIARLRRTPGSLAEASMDLGARGWQTLRYVTLPLTATALVSGALLAFALSFDEVIVTVFTAGAQNTLPLWIFGAIRLVQPQEPPLGLGKRLHVLLEPLVLGDSQDFRDIGVHVRVAVRALAVDLRCAELGVGPGDVRAAEQPEVLLGDGEPPGVADHVEQ